MILERKPRYAPKPADKETASNPMGAASATVRCKKKPKSGTDKMAPPAPVRPRSTPTNIPRAIPISVKSKD